MLIIIEELLPSIVLFRLMSLAKPEIHEDWPRGVHSEPSVNETSALP